MRLYVVSNNSRWHLDRMNAAVIAANSPERAIEIFSLNGGVEKPEATQIGFAVNGIQEGEVLQDFTAG